MDERRSPSLILGLDRGTDPGQAAVAFAAASRRLARSDQHLWSLDDLTWALHQLEQSNAEPVPLLAEFRAPADPSVYPVADVNEMLPKPEPLPRTTPATGQGRAHLEAEAVRELLAAQLTSSTLSAVQTAIGLPVPVAAGQPSPSPGPSFADRPGRERRQRMIMVALGITTLVLLYAFWGVRLDARGPDVSAVDGSNPPAGSTEPGPAAESDASVAEVEPEAVTSAMSGDGGFAFTGVRCTMSDPATGPLMCQIPGGLLPQPAEPTPSSCGSWDLLLLSTEPAGAVSAACGQFNPSGPLTNLPVGAHWERGEFRCERRERALRCTNGSGEQFALDGRHWAIGDAADWVALADGLPAEPTSNGEDAQAPLETDLDDTRTSPDGGAWVRISHRATAYDGMLRSSMRAVTAGGPGVVAVGLDDGRQAAAIWTSGDGERWTRVPHDETTFGGTGLQELWAVSRNGSGVVAVGLDPGRSAAAVWTSSDGRNWSRVTPDDPAFEVGGRAGMRSVIEVGTGLLAVGNDDGRSAAAVWVSPDGRTWSRVPHQEQELGGEGRQVMFEVAATSWGFVGVGVDAGRDAGAVWVSQDGSSWRRVPHDEAVFGGAGTQWIWAVVAHQGGLVAVGEDSGSNGAAVWVSDDGQTWARIPHDEAVLGGSGMQGMRSVVSEGSALTAVGIDTGREAGAAWTSPDGRTWTRLPADQPALGGLGQQSLRGVAAADAGLVAVGVDEDLPSDRWEEAMWLLPTDPDW